MKALKDCEWEVVIAVNSDNCYYYRTTKFNLDFHFSVYSKSFKTAKAAKNNWIKFAEVNGITNYKFVEE